MKVIKRDGRIVDYDRSKIRIAIEKANKEVTKKEKATKEDINNVIEYIEELGKKRILVEDIQDIIEKKLMEFGRFELAKKYIVYRYTRALVRKSNTTDESILGLIRQKNKSILEDNPNKNTAIASTQRDLIAGEVSKDLTKRILLPEKITNAWEDGILYFHDADYFVQPICNSCLVNIGDMLDNGTVINEKMVESPKTFQVACIVTTQIIATIASNQYGGQSIDMIHLGKYLRKSKIKIEKEIKEELGENADKDIIQKLLNRRLKSELDVGIQLMQYQINTLMATNGQLPVVTLFLHLDKDDEYLEENAMIIEEILRQREKGIKDFNGEYVAQISPKLIYVLDELNCLDGGKYDYLTKLAINCSKKRQSPYFISAKRMREFYDGNVFSPIGGGEFLNSWKDENGEYKFEGRFNQGIVSINLPQIGIIADGDEDKFWNELDTRLEICKEALMCRHYALIGTLSDISPIHWKHGAIARLEKGEKIDNLLVGEYSTLSLGYIGLYELTKIMKGVSQTEKTGHDFAIKVMKYLKEKVDKWSKGTNVKFTLYGISSGNLGTKFARHDKEEFGTIEGITDKGYYTNSYYINSEENLDLFERLKIESEFQKYSKGGACSCINISDIKSEEFDWDELIKFLYENILYTEFRKD